MADFLLLIAGAWVEQPIIEFSDSIAYLSTLLASTSTIDFFSKKVIFSKNKAVCFDKRLEKPLYHVSPTNETPLFGPGTNGQMSR